MTDFAGPTQGAQTPGPGTTTSRLVTFVSCIEHGRLEDETVLMLQTLRANGGRLAQARVLLVVGRRGAPLADTTRSALQRLGAEMVYASEFNPAPWFNYANKIAAISVAQKLATTPLVAWLDSDVLIADEPAGLLLDDDVDFAGRCEHQPPAMVSNSPLHRPYWDALCGLTGIRSKDLPHVRLSHLGLDLQVSFNSGIFVWRRDSVFAQAYRELFIKLLRSRLAQHDGNFFTADQVIIGPVLVAHRLRWKHLDIADHHMVFHGQLEVPGAVPDMSGSHLIHYSRSMTLPYRGMFLGRLQSELPELHAQVVAQGPLQRHEGLLVTGVALALKAFRGLQWKLFAARTRPVARGV